MYFDFFFFFKLSSLKPRPKTFKLMECCVNLTNNNVRLVRKKEVRGKMGRVCLYHVIVVDVAFTE